MPLYTNRLLPETERVILGSALTLSYQHVGTIFANPSAMMILVNNTVDVLKISLDGTNDHFTLLPGATVILDENSNAVSNAEFKIAKATQVWAKIAEVSDALFLSTFYAQ